MSAIQYARQRVAIRKNDCDEFEVPTPGASSLTAGLYFTDDKQDALDTVSYSWAQFPGEVIDVTIRRGTYLQEDA